MRMTYPEATRERMLAQLRAGHAVIVSARFLDWTDANCEDQIRTALNRNRIGFNDAYVAWIGEEHQPADMTRRDDGFVVASGKYSSDIL